MDEVLENPDLLIMIFRLSGRDPVFMQVCNEWTEILLKAVARGNIEKPIMIAGNHAPYDSASEFTKLRFTPRYHLWSLRVNYLTGSGGRDLKMFGDYDLALADYNRVTEYPVDGELVVYNDYKLASDQFEMILSDCGMYEKLYDTAYFQCMEKIRHLTGGYDDRLRPFISHNYYYYEGMIGMTERGVALCINRNINPITDPALPIINQCEYLAR
jgi:hypothetical protein